MNKNTDKILTELEEAFYDIPFENSDFQNKSFVMQSQQTPARAYRAIGLRMFSKLQAINELKYGRETEDIDIEEMREQIADPDFNKFEKRRLDVKIRQKLEQRNYTNKLLNDAIHELNFLHNEFAQLPKYSRETFELEERAHFTNKLALQVQSSQLGGASGSYESLAHMTPEASSGFAEMVEKVNSGQPLLGADIHPMRAAGLEFNRKNNGDS